MKRLNLALTISALCTGLAMPTLASEQGSSRMVAYAEVVDARPIYQTVERRIPVENCWVEQVREQQPVYYRASSGKPKSATGTILGSVIGGAIGNAVGAGDENKKVGTVVGAILGASVGRDISRNGSNRQYSHTEVSYRDVQRCEVKERVEMEEVPAGYSVTYRYNGETYTTRTRRDPGNKLKIAINIQPLEH
ncbi:glycine zipper 2TM domain-containing protein [Teredinibacter haidensis]|uniref:glycine zipper 2TM domain-containing protein n=1 Tax=Teredinibacter haidensis TaxID=2731755 RepID=UPI000948A803|nr:glycine zipper 2TM domain-containing protein [Teredinibacter haidensis]